MNAELRVGLGSGCMIFRDGECRYEDVHGQVWVLRPTADPDLPLIIELESRACIER